MRKIQMSSNRENCLCQVELTTLRSSSEVVQSVSYAKFLQKIVKFLEISQIFALFIDLGVDNHLVFDKNRGKLWKIVTIRGKQG